MEILIKMTVGAFLMLLGAEIVVKQQDKLETKRAAKRESVVSENE